jgi:hypothetical protein
VAAWALAQTKLEYGPEETLPIIRDNDNKLVDAFDRVTDGTDAEVLTTPYQAPKANAIPLRAIPGQRTAQMPRLLPHPERAPSRQQDFGIAPVASAGFER